MFTTAENIELKLLKPYVRDGVDVYIDDTKSRSCEIVFVFLSSRKRIQLKADTKFVPVLALLDGEKTIEDVAEEAGISQGEAQEFVNYLASRNIVVSKSWFEDLLLDHGYKQVVEKQLYFLMDTLTSPEEVLAVQTRIKLCKIALFGVGATGSWLLVELLQMGFQDISLYDFKELEADGVSRHAFFSTDHVHEKKVEFYKEVALKINPSASISAKIASIMTDSGVLEGLSEADLIINCADEPYVGYTSIFLSRYCVQHDKPLFVGGGFDAHLGCLGEMIIPRKTPCSDCYNEHFREALKDWKPEKHPVSDRAKGFGGLAPLSVFSASTAALSILRFFLNEEEFVKSAGGRGEFKFDNYEIDSFVVHRNHECRVCGE